MHFLISFYRLKGLTAHLCRVSCYSLCCKKKKKNGHIFRHLITFQFLLFPVLFCSIFNFLSYFAIFFQVHTSGDYEFYFPLEIECHKYIRRKK